MGNRTMAVSGVLALIIAVLAFAGTGNDWQLQLLIDRAVEREAAFDSVEAQYSFSSSFGGGMGRMQPQRDAGNRPRGGQDANRPPADSAPETAPPRRQDRPRDSQQPSFGGQRGGERPSAPGSERQRGGGPSAPGPDRRSMPGTGSGGPFTMETSVHWAKSDDQVLLESEMKGQLPMGDRGISNVKFATDGETSKALMTTGDGYRGFVSSENAGPRRLMSVTPDDFVIGVPSSGASILDLLTARTEEIRMRRRGGEQVTVSLDRQTRIVGEEVIDGHKCVVVEVTQTSPFARRGASTVERLYFGEDVNYAVVRFEQGGIRGEQFVARSAWTMSDFREVRPGIFVPFSAVSQRAMRGGEMREVFRFTLNSIDFPGGFPAEFFDIKFPPGTRVRDGIADVSYMAGMPEEELDFLSTEPYLDELPEEPVLEAAPEASAVPVAGEGMTWTTSRLIGVSIAVFVVLVTATVVYWRSRG